MTHPNHTARDCPDCGGPVKGFYSARCLSCKRRREAEYRATLDNPNPSGLCLCGCGERTALARWTDRNRGRVLGQPVRYVPGHTRRKGHTAYVVDPVTGCWNWQRDRDDNGYGRIKTGNGRETTGAHRRAYEQARGPIPSGFVIDHLCRNPACVNPDHLEAVPHPTNLRRGNSTKLTVEQVREIRALAGTASAREIGLQFGIAKETVLGIFQRRTWKDVA